MLLLLSLIIGLPTRSIGPYVKKGKLARKGQQGKDVDVKTAMKGRKGQRGQDGTDLPCSHFCSKLLLHSRKLAYLQIYRDI